MNYFKKFLFLNLLVFSLFTFNAKPMGFIKGLAKRIYNPVVVDLNVTTAERITDFVNRNRQQYAPKNVFSITQTRPNTPQSKFLRARLTEYEPVGNGEFVGERGTFFNTQEFLNFARRINFREKLKLSVAFTALGCLLYSGLYWYKRSDIYIDIPVLKISIFTGLSFVGYNFYKYLKNKDPRYEY